jgi:surfactin synthase thioesterase subunit
MPAVLFASGSPAPSRRDPDRFPDTNDDAALIADLRKQGGTPQEVFDSPELLRLTLDTLRADYRVCKTFAYRRNAPLPLPVQIFAGRHDDIEPHRIEAWWDEADESFALNWFDGGHFFIREHEKQVLRIVERSLRDVIEESRRVGTVSA